MSTAFFTICCTNYLPRAMVLLRSLIEQGAGDHLYLVLAEEPASRPALDLPQGVHLLGLEDLSIPRVEQLAFYYNITEFNTALKPHVFLRLFAAGHEAVFYLDPDIRFYAPVAPLVDQLREGDILLTPHIAKPDREDGLFPTVRDCLHVGQFNLGFAAIQPTPQALAFTRWWAERLMEDGLMEPGGYHFVDQLWASQAPSFVDRVKVLRQSGYNMAYWNICQRSLRRDGAVWMTEDGPLCFFHFSGYQFHHPKTLSRYSTRNNAVPADSALGRLLADYRRETQAMAERYPVENSRYSFATYRDGEPVTAQDRRRFRALSLSERLAVADPFHPENRHRLARGRFLGSEPWRFILLGHLSRVRDLLPTVPAERLHREMLRYLIDVPGEPLDRPDAPPAERLALAVARLAAGTLTDSRLWQALASLLASSQLPDLALDCYQHALALEPDNLDLHLFRSDALRYAGRFEEALAALAPVAARDEAWPGLHFKRGQACSALGRFDLARQEFRAEPSPSPWSQPAREWLDKLPSDGGRERREDASGGRAREKRRCLRRPGG